MTEPATETSSFEGDIKGSVPKSPETSERQAADWLAVTWNDLSDRESTILSRRMQGETLQDIATDQSLTRERVRQLQKRATNAMVAAAEVHDRHLMSRLALTLGSAAAIENRHATAELPPAPADVQKVMLKVLGFRHPRTWDGELVEWWTRMPEELDRRLNAVVALAPLSHDDLLAALTDVGLTFELPVTTLLRSPNSKLNESPTGWYRPSRAGRDLAFLYLQSQGAPRTTSEIAAAVGGTTSEHAIRETMRREDAFAQVRPEGTWTLTDWRVPGSDNRYSSAEETVIEVVRELGPISLNALQREVVRRYPVTSWRITQCLSNHQIGLTATGLYDLTERGATPIEDTEPRRPDTIEAKGHITGVKLNVNHDLLRGSGIPVNRWLTWHLGLRIVPSLKTFRLDSGGDVTIKRASSNAQISSLRTAVQSLDVVEGCKIVLILNTESGTAKIRHVCPEGDCPAA